MVDYEIGYGKPPKHSQFKKGVCANPRGRPRRRDTQIGEVVRGFLSGKAPYREKGRTKKTSRLELAIKRHVTAALNGDVGSAAMLLKMRAHGLKFGDVGPLIIQLVTHLACSPDSVLRKKKGWRTPQRKVCLTKLNRQLSTEYCPTALHPPELP